MDSRQSDRDSLWPKALVLFLAFVAVVLPLVSASTLRRGFDPPKSISLSILTFAILTSGAIAGEIGRSIAYLFSKFRLVLIVVSICIGALTISVVCSPNPWTAVLGTLPRRQGWITEFTEIIVLFAALLASSKGYLSPYTFARFIVIAGLAVSVSAICQSHWVGFLDPNEWNNEIFNRVAGSMGSPSQLETYLALLFPLTLGALFHDLKHRNKSAIVICILAVVAEIVAMLLARGRSGLVGGILGTLVLFAFQNPSGTFTKIASRASFIAILLMGAGVAILNIPGRPFEKLLKGDDAITHVLQRLSRVTDFNEGGGRVRVILGEATEAAMAARPAAWIVGFGPDEELDALAPFDTEERVEIEKKARTPQDRPHQFLAEKVMSAGLFYAAGWLAILSLTIVAVFKYYGIIKKQGGMAIFIFAGAVCGGAGAYFLQSGLALVGAGVLLGAAASVILFSTIAKISGTLQNSGAATRLSEEPIPISWVGAMVAHFVAGSVGVSMAPERTLAWAVAGMAIGYCSISRKVNDKAGGRSDCAVESPLEDGFFIGAACASILPLYSYYMFRWIPSPRPIYAAAILPFVIIFPAFLLKIKDKIRFLVEAGLVIAAGFFILLICSKLTNGEAVEAVLDFGPMSHFVPAMLLITVAFTLAPLMGSRCGTQDIPRAPRRSVLAIPFAAILLVYGWIAWCELRSDTTFLAALRMNRWAAQTDEMSRRIEDEDTKIKARATAAEYNNYSHALVEEARRIGAPLSFLGCPSLHDRLPASIRPQ